MEETHYAYWLSTMLPIGPVAIQKLLDYAGSYEEIWELTADHIESDALSLTANQRKALLAPKNANDIVCAYEQLSEHNIRFIYKELPDFPHRLLNLPNCPHSLFYKGTLPDPHKLSIAIVGARTCSEYGRYISRKLALSVAGNDMQVISGLARGIDGVSQKAALDGGGYTCAVLGCGVDICYPEENRDIYNRLVQSGGIISEYPPGTAPRSSLFPLRNRIISALSDIVVVVEARERSGSLITADMALEQGKDVYAFPGRVTDSLSHGCNRLIQQGAGIILSPEEFIADLNVNYSARPGSSNQVLTNNTISFTDDSIYQMSLYPSSSFSEADIRILNVLNLDPKSINKIQDETALDIGTLMNSLTRLSIQGFILQNGSHYIKKTNN